MSLKTIAVALVVSMPIVGNVNLSNIDDVYIVSMSNCVLTELRAALAKAIKAQDTRKVRYIRNQIAIELQIIALTNGGE